MIILTPIDPQRFGVVAYDNGGALKSFGPASKNPARADAGKSRAAMRREGSQVRLSFDSSPIGTAYTGEGEGDRPDNISSVTFAIEGNSGEAAGSPVTLHLSAGGAPSPNFTVLINDADYTQSRDKTITGLRVGDRFKLFAGVTAGGSGKPFSAVVTLSVQPA